jgi:uncharacterized protein
VELTLVKALGLMGAIRGAAMADHADIAARLLAAAEAGDTATVRAIYHPDARIWRCTDPIEQPGLSVDAHIATLQWARAGLAALLFRQRTCVATPDGFAQTFVVEAHTKSGERHTLPVMAVGVIRDGRVLRKEEYLNMLELNAIIVAAAAGSTMLPAPESQLLAPSRVSRPAVALLAHTIHPYEALLGSYLRAIEARNYDGVAACFAPEARIWHNIDAVDGPEKNCAENISLLRWTNSFQRRLTYQVRWFQPTPDGFVATHVLTAQTVLGDVYSLALSMRATVEDGKILRLEEYFDAAALVPLRIAIEAKRQAG